MTTNNSELDLFQTFSNKLLEAFRRIPDQAVADTVWIVKEAVESTISEHTAEQRLKEIANRTPIWEKQ